MRIAMVSEHASPLAVLGGHDAGGQNVHVAALAGALAERGHDVVVHTRRDEPGLPVRQRMAPRVTVDHITAGPAREIAKDELWPWMDAFADQLYSRWRRDRPDVVHAHFWMSGHAACVAAARLGIPVALTFHALGIVKERHQGGADTSPASRQAVEAELLQRVDQVIATCTDEVFELVRLGAEPSRISVVPCGVDLSLFQTRGPRAPRGTRRRLLCVSRLVERKGVGHAISALAQLPDDVELVIAGGPDAAGLDTDHEAQRLRALAAELGVAERVELVGRVDRADLPALMRSADLVLCLPWYEPFGIVPLEAMACGVPVVATAVGGLVDTVLDGQTGRLVPPQRPDLVAEAVGELLADEPRRAALGRKSRERARSRYTWQRVAALTERVYEELLTPADQIAQIDLVGQEASS